MKSSRRWPKILAIIVALVAIFVFTAPASLLKDQVQQANLPVQVAGYQGRLLNGQVKTIFVEGINYSNLSWRLNPLSLLSGEFSAVLTIEDEHADLGVDVSFKDDTNWQISELNGRLALPHVAKMSRALNMAKPSGDIVFNDIASALENSKFNSSTGTVEWQDASITINGQNLPLGLIAGKLSDDGDYLYLDFNGQESIQPAGQIKLTPQGSYELALTINPDRLPTNLSWLSSMGQTEAGRLSIDLKGRL